MAMLQFAKGSKASYDVSSLVTDVAVVAPFRITVNERGFLESQKNVTLASKVPGSTTIISIVPEGTYVKEGTIVCQLDSSTLVDKARQQKIDVTQAESALANAIENTGIQKTQNESDIAAADLKWELAKLDFKKYVNGELEQERNKNLGEITLKEEELTRSYESLAFTKRMVLKGYKSQSDLEAEQLAVTKSELALKVQKETLNVLNEYTAKRKIAELEANAKEYERELERVKRKAKAAMIKAEADLESRKLTLEVEIEKYNRWNEQIANSTLRAPQDGEVVYAKENSRRGSSESIIEKGTSVRERQAIIQLPDVTKMKVDARIHESAINQLEIGQPVFIRINAYPNDVFNGIIDDISSVPLSGSWPNTDVKEYEVNIFLTDSVEVVSKLRPGLTAEIEILASNRQDVLQIPVQAVVNLGSKYFSYVLKNGTPKIMEVEVGEANDTDIEIIKGIEEGYEVVMNPRSIFEDELNELEAELTIDEEANESEQAKKIETKAKKENANKPAADKKKKRSKDAEKRGGGGGDFMSRLDKNGDGALEKSEVPEQMKSRFDSMDADKDGKITKAEMDAAMKKFRGGQ